MNMERTQPVSGVIAPRKSVDRLESFGIYKLACQLFDDFWTDSEILGKDSVSYTHLTLPTIYSV